jgi:uncharacterized damage-inducible protein DinB
MADEEDLRYPIGKEEAQKEFNAEYNEPLKTQLLTEIKMLPSNLELAIQNLDAAQLDMPYRFGGWTVKQLIHHIADSHINAYTRFKLGLTEDNPIIKPYDQDAWAILPDAQKLPVNISLTLLHALHIRWYQLMYDLNESQWQRTIYHPERKVTITLWSLLKSYSWHSRHHTAHITDLRERMKWS